MLTLKDSFISFIELCLKNGACMDSGAVQTMNAGYKTMEAGITKGETIQEALEEYLKNKQMDSWWSRWVLTSVGKELDESVRWMFLQKIVGEPTLAMEIHLKCEYLTDKEEEFLASIYKGQLPNAEKELATGVVTTAKAILTATPIEPIKPIEPLEK